MVSGIAGLGSGESGMVVGFLKFGCSKEESVGGRYVDVLLRSWWIPTLYNFVWV
jgi:hypothetical protein